MAFKVTSQREGQGAMGAGELNPANATHEFLATDDQGNEMFAGVADDDNHPLLRDWARAAHGAKVEIHKMSRKAAPKP